MSKKTRGVHVSRLFDPTLCDLWVHSVLYLHMAPFEATVHAEAQVQHSFMHITSGLAVSRGERGWKGDFGTLLNRAGASKCGQKVDATRLRLLAYSWLEMNINRIKQINHNHVKLN